MLNYSQTMIVRILTERITKVTTTQRSKKAGLTLMKTGNKNGRTVGMTTGVTSLK